MGWTDERVELLKKLWMEGFSASQIAAELGEGVTRNAVIGKVHRLKLSGRAKPASSAPRARTAPRPARRVAAPVSGSGGRSGMSSVAKQRSMVSAPMMGATALKISEDLEVEAYVAPQTNEIFIPENERIGLLGLTEQTCKWPIGDPMSKDFYFCGRHSNDGKPYCEFHARKAYHQVEKKKR
jgi:GcrA cell cycle regulator